MNTLHKTLLSLAPFLRNNILSLSALVVSAATLALVVVPGLVNRNETIAVVRSNVLIRGFKAMKDAQERYDNKQKAWQANLTTLEEDLQSSVDAFRVQYARLSNDEVEKRREQLEQKRINYEQYSHTLQEKAAAEESDMMQGVLNQINSFAVSYGEKNGYDVILGTTAAGSVLYGRNTVDITDEILEALNTAYESGQMEVSNVSQ